MFQLSTKYTGWIHLPLIDRPSVKRITHKNFLSDFDEAWWSCRTHRYYNITKFYHLMEGLSIKGRWICLSVSGGNIALITDYISAKK